MDDDERQKKLQALHMLIRSGLIGTPQYDALRRDLFGEPPPPPLDPYSYMHSMQEFEEDMQRRIAARRARTRADQQRKPKGDDAPIDKTVLDRPKRKINLD